MTVDLVRWNPRDHPRDEKGRFTRGQRIRINIGVGHKELRAVVRKPGPDRKGYIEADIHDTRGSYPAKVRESAATAAEPREAAVRRRRAGRGARAAGVAGLVGAGAWFGAQQLGKDDRAARALQAFGRGVADRGEQVPDWGKRVADRAEHWRDWNETRKDKRHMARRRRGED